MECRRSKLLIGALIILLGLGTLSACFSGGWQTTSISTPESVQITARIVEIHAGFDKSFAIMEDRGLWAWGIFGGDFSGVTNDNRHTPAIIMDDIIAVGTGESFRLVVKSDGTLWAWGVNRYGQLGDGTTMQQFSPVMIIGDVIAVSAGDYHSMAITTDGTLWTWGSNFDGKLGDGTTEDRHSPV